METRTAGSASGLGKRTSSNAGTAPQADSSDSGQSYREAAVAYREPGAVRWALTCRWCANLVRYDDNDDDVDTRQTLRP